ncbi:hypothetical protein AURDEDRAFT_89480 [Auricularia subglabra TFB-10046 SS5]|nr:hypothetical protein AURDEDRAFT_89480 [Auricularia subglabra TFB-10046 SS5]
MEDDLEAELRNPFPSPPSHYRNYTSQNLRLLSLFKSRTDGQDEAETSQSQREVLADEPNVPEWDLRTLEPPRVDWVVEDGHYSVFGDTWPIQETIPSLSEAGGTQLYPADPTVDRRPALQAILKTLLVSYTHLLSSVVEPPPVTDELPPAWNANLDWIYTMGLNIMSAANDLRPAQARANLEGLMRRQLDQRREETRRIHETCDRLEDALAALQARTAGAKKEEPMPPPMPDVPMDAAAFLSDPGSDSMVIDVMPLTKQDVLAWADVID